MRWFLIWAALLCGAANAQMMQSIVNGKSIPPVAYVGPGDLVSGATVWWGLRGYSAAYASPGTGKAVQLTNFNASATQDIVILPNGNLDTASAVTFAGTPGTGSCTVSGTTITCSGLSGSIPIYSVVQAAGLTQPCILTLIFSGSVGSAANPLTGASCGTVGSSTATTFLFTLTVAKFYDQSGSGHDGSPSAGQWQLLPYCLGTSQLLPCVYMNRTAPGIYAATVSSTSNTTLTQTWTGNRHTSGAVNLVAEFGSGVAKSGFASSANQALMNAGSNVFATGVNEDTWHDVQAVFNGASSIFNVDGSNAGAVSPGTIATGQTRIAWGDDEFTGSINYVGPSTEMGSWTAVFNSTQYGNMHTNMATYWSIP